MVVDQGDIFWIDLDEPYGSEPGFRHPFVVVQNNMFNYTGINTVVVCPITSNLKRAKSPGNVRLNKNEAGLSKESVVNISQITALDKDRLIEKIGSLSEKRLQQVISGIHLLLDPREV